MIFSEVHRIFRTSSFNTQNRNRLIRNAKSDMKTDLEHKLKAGLHKGQKNLDVMMDMMQMRSGVQNKLLAEERQYYERTAYRPY